MCSQSVILASVSQECLPERPVTFAFQTLSVSEKNYSQIEKEALSLIYAFTTTCMAGYLH